VSDSFTPSLPLPRFAGEGISLLAVGANLATGAAKEEGPVPPLRNLRALCGKRHGCKQHTLSKTRTHRFHFPTAPRPSTLGPCAPCSGWYAAC
jgi:hypothetical protein